MPRVSQQLRDLFGGLSDYRNLDADQSLVAFSAFLDLYFALYPAFVFRKLGWNIRKKLALSVVMGLGIWCVFSFNSGPTLSKPLIHDYGPT